MILGIGIDLVDIGRINRIVDKYPVKFSCRILSKRELREYRKILVKGIYSREKANRFLAKRFAAKEAVSKAFGTGIGSQISFSAIDICNDKFGKPFVKIFGLNKSHIPIGQNNIHISITDEKHFAQAIVILEG